jgi:fatty acid amide hydrolase 2
MNPLLTASGTQLARMIRENEVSSIEIVETHIRRIQSVNPTLNAMVRPRFEQAREEARRADKQLRSRKRNLGPFHGVPCTIKECFSFTGMPQTSGLVSRKNIVADHDATAVARLRAAGCIPMGVTNVPELCMWMETHNRIYGRTNNAYDPRRIVGGSSGGEGAIISSGGSPFGLGSDIGGSIRMPAFFNGVFGHKATGGTVPNTGQFPLAHGAALRYLATGPLARRAKDLWPLLKILAGPDGQDSGCAERDLGDPANVRIPDLVVLDVVDNGAVPVSDDLRDAQRKCIEFLQSRGARIRKLRFRDLKHSFLIWSSMLSSAGGPTYYDLLGDGKPIPLAGEIAKCALGRSDYTLPSLVLAATEKLRKYSGMQARFVEKGKKLRAEISEAIGPDGVMLFPSFSTPAPFHKVPLLHPFHFVYTAIVNVLELPATQVPLGLNRAMQPLGVQVVGNHGGDHITIAVARELERMFGGWVPPVKLGGWD